MRLNLRCIGGVPHRKALCIGPPQGLMPYEGLETCELKKVCGVNLGFGLCCYFLGLLWGVSPKVLWQALMTLL